MDEHGNSHSCCFENYALRSQVEELDKATDRLGFELLDERHKRKEAEAQLSEAKALVREAESDLVFGAKVLIDAWKERARKWLGGETCSST